mmetsp:Transcript_56742/g.164600  ORF Transcript_56742/g.164600 Transcript_56742/m.164600 type:complete len:412 (-) Transcript_56742:650-1885(-)
MCALATQVAEHSIGVLRIQEAHDEDRAHLPNQQPQQALQVVEERGTRVMVDEQCQEAGHVRITRCENAPIAMELVAQHKDDRDGKPIPHGEVQLVRRRPSPRVPEALTKRVHQRAATVALAVQALVNLQDVLREVRDLSRPHGEREDKGVLVRQVLGDELGALHLRALGHLPEVPQHLQLLTLHLRNGIPDVADLIFRDVAVLACLLAQREELRGALQQVLHARAHALAECDVRALKRLLQDAVLDGNQNCVHFRHYRVQCPVKLPLLPHPAKVEALPPRGVQVGQCLFRCRVEAVDRLSDQQAFHALAATAEVLDRLGQYAGHGLVHSHRAAGHLLVVRDGWRREERRQNCDQRAERCGQQAGDREGIPLDLRDACRKQALPWAPGQESHHEPDVPIHRELHRVLLRAGD